MWTWSRRLLARPERYTRNRWHLAACTDLPLLSFFTSRSCCRSLATDVQSSSSRIADTDEIADAIDPLLEEAPVMVPEQASMDKAVKHVVKARFHFFYDTQISENNRLAQLFADAINVAPGLQYHVRKRLVRFSSLKFQESSKARRRLRRDLDTLLEGNVACSEDLVDLSKRFWDPPGLQTVAPDGDGVENVWDPAADPVTRRTLLSLALTWDPELQSLYRVVRTFFSEQWLGPSVGAGDVAPVQQCVVDMVDEDEQRLITATALCHKELTGVLGRRKQNSLYQLLNRLQNRHVAASHAWQQARNPPPKTRNKGAKPKGKRRPPAVPKLVTAEIVESEVVARLQKHPRALAIVRSLFGGSLQRAHLKSLTDNAVLLAQVKRHFRDIEMTEPEDEANASAEPEDKQVDKHRLTFVASDVMNEMIREREGAQVVEDDGVGQWERDADRAPSPVVWHMRSQVRGYAQADEDIWAPSLPESGGAVVFTNMQSSWTLARVNETLASTLGEVVDMKLLPRQAFGVPLQLFLSQDPGAGGLLPISVKHTSTIDVALREDGRPAADSAHVMDCMPKPASDTNVLGVLQFGSDHAYNRALSAAVRTFGVRISGRLCRALAPADVPVCLQLSNAQVFRNAENLEHFLNSHLPQKLKVRAITSRKRILHFEEFLEHSIGETEEAVAVIQFSNYLQALAAKTALSYVTLNRRPMHVSWVFPGDDPVSTSW